MALVEPLVAETQLHAHFHTIIPERVDNIVRFNVMPGRPVEETLHIPEYRIADGYIEAYFDRNYKSSMLNSPSYLIFLSVVAHMQKIMYVYECHHLGLHYDTHAAGVLKIWPTTVNLEMQRMIHNEPDIVHCVFIDSFMQVAPKRCTIEAHSNVNDCSFISGTTPLFVL